MKKYRKGRDFELSIAKDLRESGLEPKATRMARSGAIDDLKSDIHCPTLPLHIECKRQEKWNVEKFYQQALEGKKKHQVAIVVMRKNNKTTMSMLAWKDLIWFLQLAKETGQLQAEYGFTKRKQLNK